ncbi:MAG: hypothetical protein KBD52_01145 [Candidatus Pacebacteria bacterium]|nr:hypothetical protein [Candidatus Paceibacterota bacterium]
MKIESGPKLNTHYEHLTPGVKPIMTCIGAPEDFGHKKGEIFQRFNENFKNVTNVAYFHKAPGFTDENVLNEKDKNYVISNIDNTNKFSEEFLECTSVIVSGLDKETGENISFLSHQNPNDFLFRKRGEFIQDFEKKLEEIRVRCKEGTVDAVILGGNYMDIISKNSPNGDTLAEIYVETINLLSNEVEKFFKFKPEIINGPKFNLKEQDDIFYDNKKRRVYFIRPEVNTNTQSFVADSFEDQKDEGF